MEMKSCSKCKVEKEIEAYFFRNKKTGKRHAQCKSCYNEVRKYKEHYEKYKDEYKDRANKRIKTLIEENRINMLTLLKQHTCMDCGEDNIITFEFDHRDRNEKKYGIATMLKHFKWEQILEEIKKCDIVCANCHRIRTANQFNWYKLDN